MHPKLDEAKPDPAAMIGGPPVNTKPLLGSINDARVMLGTPGRPAGSPYVYKLIREGRIKAYRRDNRTLIDLQSIRDLMFSEPIKLPPKSENISGAHAQVLRAGRDKAPEARAKPAAARSARPRGRPLKRKAAAHAAA